MLALFRTCRNRMQDMRWSYLFGLVFFIMAMSLVLSLGARHGSPRARLAPLAMYAVLGLFAAKMLSGRYEGMARLRRVRASGAGPRAMFTALLPIALLAWMRVDAANLRATCLWLARRPLPAPPAGTRLTFLAKSSYSSLFFLMLFSVMVELPMDGMIVGAVSNDAGVRVWLHILMPAFAIYTIMWLLGDRRQMMAGYQVLDESHLLLDIGARLSARLPLAAIVRAQTVTGMDAWCELHGVRPGECILATPADGANVVIEIDPAAQLRLSHWHVEKAAPRYLFLFTDEPGKLQACLKVSGDSILTLAR